MCEHVLSEDAYMAVEMASEARKAHRALPEFSYPNPMIPLSEARGERDDMAVHVDRSEKVQIGVIHRCLAGTNVHSDLRIDRERQEETY